MAWAHQARQAGSKQLTLRAVSVHLFGCSVVYDHSFIHTSAWQEAQNDLLLLSTLLLQSTKSTEHHTLRPAPPTKWRGRTLPAS